VSDAPTAHIDLTMRHRAFMRHMGTVKRALVGLRAGLQRVASTARNMLMIGGGALAGMIALTGKQAQAEARLEAVLRSTGNAAGYNAQQLKDMAAAFQKVTTYGDETTIEMMAMLATFKNIKGPIFKDAVAAILDVSTVLGQDLRGAAIQVGKALNDPAVGLTYLRRSGISFTEEQTKMIKVLVQTNRLFEAQRIMLDEIASQFGGAAQATAKTFWGRMVQLKNTLGDLGETIGSAFIPEIERLVKRVREFVPKAVDWVKANKELIVSTAKWVAGISAAVVALNMLIPVLQGAYVAAIALGSHPVLAGLAALTAAVVAAQVAVVKLNAAMEASATESERAAKLWGQLKIARQALEQAESPEQRIKALQDEKTALEGLVAIEKARAEAAKSKVTEIEGRSWVGRTWKGGGEAEASALSGEMQRAEQAAAKLQTQLDAVNASLAEVVVPQEKFTASVTVGAEKVDSFIASLEKERALLTATGVEARLVAAGIEGLTDAQRRLVEGIYAEIEGHDRAKSAAERAYDAKKKASEQTISFLDGQIRLLREIDTLTGKITPTEAHREELADQGLSIQQIDKRITLEKELAALQDAQHEKQQARSVAGSFASLTGLHRSMSEAAAKIGYENKRTAAAQTAGGGSQSPVKKTEANTGLTAKGIERLVAICERVERGLPLVGAFGA